MGYWPSSVGCGCGAHFCGCIRRDVVCVPRGDDCAVIVNVFDDDGDEFDVTGATEIVFIVSEGVEVSSTMFPGGNLLIEKRLSDGGIVIAGTGYQFLVTITDDETKDLPRTNLYYECQVTTSAGLKKTVAAGIFKAENTQIKDIA